MKENMDKHVQVIGVLWIVFGFIGLSLGLLVLFLLLGVSFIPRLAEASDIAPGILRIVAYGISSFLALLGLPKIIAGIGLLKRREWARILTVVLSFLELWNVPFGLALSVYSLVILFNQETVRIFNPGFPASNPTQAPAA
jgi:hypothetical protein